VPKQSSAEKVAHGSCRRRISMVGFNFYLFSSIPCLLFATGIDVNSRFTSLLRSGSTSESWYGNYFGAPSVSRHPVWLLIHDVDCTKRGSGWHPSRALLAWNNDHGPSLTSKALISLDFSPQFLVLLHFSLIPFRVFFFTFVP